MESVERALTINPDPDEESHGRVARQVVYVGGAYCPQSEPRAAEPPSPERTIMYAHGADGDPAADEYESGTVLQRMIAGWPAAARVAALIALVIIAAIAVATAGAGVGTIITGGLLH